MYKHFIKRILDFCISLVAIICLSPVFLLISIWLYFANKGAGVFFVQERPGYKSKIFHIYKFKTMTDERDEHGELLPPEQRLTNVGKIVRSTSIDELPQLFNVLKGDMSIIGPRPLLVRYLPLYSEYQLRRHEVRPGITGWAQSHGRNDMTWTQKFEYDVWYVDHCSFSVDLQVVAKTIKTVLKREGIAQDGCDIIEDFNGHN